MRVDYHTHHWRCGHASGEMADYVEAAIAAGVDEIGLSDHSPIYHLGPGAHERPRTAMSQLELPAYVSEMADLKDRFRDRVTVRLGVESDYVLGWDEHYRKLWSGLPLDYAIGSVHWLFGSWSIFYAEPPAGRDADAIYAAYLEATRRAALSGAYDIIGHLDCIKTAGWLPRREITPDLEETVRVLADCGVAIELNTSGWRKPITECYPRPELLRLCREYGVPATVGSDAHRPGDVGQGWQRAVSALREAGYTEIATFAGRRRTMVPLA